MWRAQYGMLGGAVSPRASAKWGFLYDKKCLNIIFTNTIYIYNTCNTNDNFQLSIICSLKKKKQYYFIEYYFARIFYTIIYRKFTCINLLLFDIKIKKLQLYFF